MSTILAIETTLGECSVAISGGASRQLSERNKQTSALPLMVQQVLAESALTLHDITAYAVTIGPGSFTGVRLGIAFTRGLALAVKRPIFAPSTLELLAFQAAQDSEIIQTITLTAAINAQRGQVYFQNFTLSEAGLPAAQATPLLAEIENLPPHCTLIGNAGALFPTPAASHECAPNAKALAAYATQLPNSATTLPEPLYLRAPDAKAQKGDLTVAV